MGRRALRAAGGVVYRISKGEPEFLLARRPRYKDWTLPKGKLDPGEGPQEAALREVREETGFGCRTEGEIGSIGYQLKSGRKKAVRYWLMRAEEGEFVANREVDKIKWLSVSDASERLSYRKERAILARGAEMVEEPHSGRIHLIRHAAAGTPTKSKADSKRTLSKKGIRQAEKLARRLTRGPITEIHSSRYVRCLHTVQPLSQTLAMPIIREKRLTEGGKLEDILDVIEDLSGTTAVLSTHRSLIELLMTHLDAKDVDLGKKPEWPKASVWTLDTYKGRVTAASYGKPPS